MRSNRSPYDVILPKLGHGETGEVVRWAVAEGDQVRAGDVVAEVETEKVTMEVESPVAGRIDALLVALNEDVPVGTPIARIVPIAD